MAPVRITIAFDLGRAMGWAVVRNDGARLASDEWRLGKGREAWRTARDNISGLVQVYMDAAGLGGVEVCYERVDFSVSLASAHMYGGLKAIVEMVSLDHGVQCCRIPPGTWKKIATGRGDADKPTYIRAASQRYGVGDSFEASGLTEKAWVKLWENECAALGIAYARVVDQGGPVRLVSGQQETMGI